MTKEPRTRDDIYKSMRSSLTGKIAKLTNFTDRSFNYVWTQAFSEEFRQLEEKALVSQLSGWIDYVGGPVTEEDLEDLGVLDSVDVQTVNNLMDDEDLDKFVEILGISRYEGSVASGTVRFTTQSSLTEIDAGITVSTSPDSDGDTIEFKTTEKASTGSGVVETGDIPIESVDVGEEYNLPADVIIRISDPPIGVKGVNNNSSTTGGEDIETNASLRSRAKSEISGAGEGGTAEGIKSYIQENIDPIDRGDVILDESVSTSPPFVDVIVDGGTDSNVSDAIEFSRPTGIEHNLVRPQIIQYGVDIDVLGTDVTASFVEDDIEDYLLSLGIGNDLYINQFIKNVMSSSDNILNIDRRHNIIERVTNETITYSSGKTDYRLDYTFEDTNGSITVEDRSGFEYVQGSDFTVEDQTGDGWPETIVFGIGSTPNDGEKIFVDHDVTVVGETLPDDRHDADLIRDEIFTFDLNVDNTFQYDATDSTYRLESVPFDNSISIVDEFGTSYREDIDWQIAPLIEGVDEETFTYSTSSSQYTLSNEITFGDVAIIDSNDNLYTLGTDYQLVDADSDTANDTIEWDIDVSGAVADDGGTTTDETTAANNGTTDDLTLLPSTPAVDDAYYIGYSNEFSSVDINVSTAGDYTGSLTWEYWNGTSWTALNNVIDDTNGFEASGRNSISYDHPTDWQTTSVETLDLYWIRARVSSFTSITTQPLGQEIEIGRKPDNSVDFTVTYNAYARTIRWDNNSNPTDGDNFTVTFDQSLYSTSQDIEETPSGIIRDASGDVYDEDAQYYLGDCSCDGELSAIIWNDQATAPDDGEEFYFTYYTEGNVLVKNREKVDPGTIDVRVI